MNKKKKERTKKQSIIIAVVFLILCGLAGFVSGFSQAIMDRKGISLAEIIPRLFHAGSHGIMIGIVCIELFLIILLIRYYVVAKRLYQNLDSDDDAGRDKIDEVFSKGGIVMAVLTPLVLVFMSIILYLEKLSADPQLGNVLFSWESRFVFPLVFVCAMIALFVYRAMWGLNKKVNPEKKGEMLDLLFHRQVEDSSDEAQKKIIYESGYRAYIVMLILSYVMEIVAFESMMMFGTGILPCIFIGIIALAGTVVNAVTGYKLEKRGWRE